MLFWVDLEGVGTLCPPHSSYIQKPRTITMINCFSMIASFNPIRGGRWVAERDSPHVFLVNDPFGYKKSSSPIYLRTMRHPSAIGSKKLKTYFEYIEGIFFNGFRFWFRLHQVSSHPQSILSLCALFENILMKHEPGKL